MKLLRIKNMVSSRCILVIERLMEDMGFELNDVDLGVIEFHEAITLEDRNKIEKAIQSLGFEILDEKKSLLVERIKNQIIELVSKDLNDLQITLPEYLQSKLQIEYDVLEELFSQQESQSIEQFYTLQEIEKVKELLVYEDFTLSEIAFKLNYNSSASLSAQFKKITGLPPSHFMEIKKQKQNIINQIN
ncbi:helix-turn-helix domain-containing protein [Capnocytophaga sp. ARDL2]|uniref:helix-turn-helix domain-containing protein n=1 Tax=Capnocytophaga sp. ARDL2 TaxID=3238809 RepID=UPI003557EC53